MIKYSVYEETFEIHGFPYELPLDELIEECQGYCEPRLLGTFDSKEEALEKLKWNPTQQTVAQFYLEKGLYVEIVYMSEEEWDGDDFDQELSRIYAPLRYPVKPHIDD